MKYPITLFDMEPGIGYDVFEIFTLCIVLVDVVMSKDDYILPSGW